MGLRTTGGRGWLLGTALLIGLPLLGPTIFSHAANAATKSGRSFVHTGGASAHRVSAHGFNRGHVKWAARGWHGRRYAGLQCVPFARNDSGIEISGNAATWWAQAAGLYQRGQQPESGAVLSFSANGRMRLGHVAVVSRVVSGREIEIDHANWWGPGNYGGVTRGVSVVDVSANNDWSAVRVARGGGDYGSIYPTNGFIYDRPDSGRMIAAAGAPAPMPALGPAPADLRGGWRSRKDNAEDFDNILGPLTYDEVAEAPDDAPSGGRHYGFQHHRHVVHAYRHSHHQR